MVPKMGRVLPEMGKVLPMEPTGGSDASYALEIAMALQKELGQSHRAIKTVMGWTGASERSVKNWISGESGPSGDYLVALIRHSDRVLECVLHMADRPHAIATSKLPDIAKLMYEVLELFERPARDDP